jgi:DNA-binding transcriptional LysR family regulator
MACTSPKSKCARRLEQVIDGSAKGACVRRLVETWRATVDEDGHHSFAVALRCSDPSRDSTGDPATVCDLARRASWASRHRRTVRLPFDSGQDLTMPRESVTTFSMQIRSHLLATGRFLTIMPRSMLHFNGKVWLLKALPISVPIQPRFVAAVTLKNRTPSPVTQLFVEHARVVAKSMRLSSS